MTLFGHPLHPMTIHFPITLYLLGVLLTGAGMWRRQTEYDRLALWSFALSWAATVIASIAGLVDQNQLDINDPRRAYINPHITGAVSLLVVNGLLVYARLRWPNAAITHRLLYAGWILLGVIILLITAWLGGELVYRWQIGIMLP